MRCKKFILSLPDYASGRLQKDAVNELEAHLRSCESCRHNAQDIAKVFHALQQCRTEAVPEDVRSRILVGVNEKIDREGRSAVVGARVKILLPALVLVVLIVGSYALLRQETPPHELSDRLHEDILSTMRGFDSSDMLSLRMQFAESSLLQDMPLAQSAVIPATDSTEQLLVESMFHDVPYSELVTASSTYLTSDEILTSVPDDLRNDIFNQLSKTHSF